MAQSRNTQQHGFGVIEVLIGVAVLAVLGYVIYTVITANSKTQTSQQADTAEQKDTPYKPMVTWMLTENGYKPSSTPPACPEQMIEVFPVDITKVTGILYPGQTRGGNYKPHGGFRFDNSKYDEITVKAPFDGQIMQGGAYLADTPGKDVQYTFDVMHECGMMYRVGHFYTLSDQLKEVAKAFPAPTSDSRTSFVNPPVTIEAGTAIATAVGTAYDNNAFFDLGVYNWNKLNAISADAAWAANPIHSSNLATHAVCWFDLLSAEDEAKVRSLPAGDPGSGKNSDYCK